MSFSKCQHNFIFTILCQAVLYVTLTGVIAVPSLCVCTFQVTHKCTQVSSSSVHQIYKCKCLGPWCRMFSGCPTHPGNLKCTLPSLMHPTSMAMRRCVMHIAHLVLHPWSCLGTTNYNAEFSDSTWKIFLIREKDKPRKINLAVSAISGIAVFYVENRDRIPCEQFPVWHSA